MDVRGGGGRSGSGEVAVVVCVCDQVYLPSFCYLTQLPTPPTALCRRPRGVPVIPELSFLLPPESCPIAVSITMPRGLPSVST